jgi:hypothetical protein
MSKLRRIAEIPAGSWTKWVVVGFWVVVLVITFPLAGKLTGAEKNDSKAWLRPMPSRPRSLMCRHTSSRPMSTPRWWCTSVRRA